MNDEVNVRLMRPEDRAAVCRLAALDSGPVPFGAWLVAEVEGELWAAMPLHGGRPVADPFRHTADLVSLLEMRAGQMAANSYKTAVVQARADLPPAPVILPNPEPDVNPAAWA